MNGIKLKAKEATKNSYLFHRDVQKILLAPKDLGYQASP